MSRAWKPGDVAMWSVDARADEIVFRYVDYKNNNEHAWATVDAGDGYPREGELRPLVVIDPEDVQEISRLRHLIRLNPSREELQAALREFADPKPPKPAEPTGLGAVVEDINGVRWVRTLDEPECWIDARIQGDWSTYADFEAVKVLSEGVSA